MCFYNDILYQIHIYIIKVQKQNTRPIGPISHLVIDVQVYKL